MCFAPQRCALFRHLKSQLPKAVWTWCALCILISKCASRHNGVHFFDISTSKSVLNVVCFVHFDFEMCFAPERRALFRHLNFQKWSEHEVFCAFWVGNVLRATTACNFSSLIWPGGSAPAALASLIFDPPEPQIIGKTECFATVLPFRALGSSFFWDFLFFDLLSSSLLSLTLPISAFHLSILSEVWLLNILRQSFYAQKLLHSKAFTHRLFGPRSFTHRKAFTQRSFYTQKLLDIEALSHRTFHTEKLLDKSFCTQKLLHRSFYTEAFTHRSFYTQKLLHTEALHTENLLHSKALTHTEAFDTQKLLDREALSNRSFHTEKHRSFYTAKPLRTESFAHRSFTHRKAFTQQSFYSQKLLHTEAFAQKSF